MADRSHPVELMRGQRALHEIGSHRSWFFALGALLVLLGSAAILFPMMATLASGLLLGWVLLLAGVLQAVHAFGMHWWRGFLLHTLGALLTVGVGAVLLLYPLPSIASLTLLLGAFFLFEGGFRAALAFRIRPAPQWGWVLTGGVVSMVLGVLVFSQWPAVAAWLLGWLVGIDLLFAGWALIALAMAAGRHRDATG